MFSSLRSRLSLTYILLIGIVLGMAAFVMIAVVRNAPVRSTNVRLQELSRLINPLINFAGQPVPRQAEALRQLAVQYDTRVMILGRDNSLLFDSGEGTLPALNRIPAALQSSQRTDPPPSGSLRDTTGKIWLYTIRTLDEGRSLMLASPRPGFQWVNVFTDDLLPPLLWASGIAILLAVLIAGVTARWVSNPLAGMAAAAKGIAAGEYTTIVEDGPQEVRDLARAFNEMVAQVRAGQKSQRDFVANVSHELKTPLTAIQGFAQAITDGTADTPEEVDRAADVIQDEAGRMHKLVIDLLELARLEGGGFALNMEDIDLSELIRSITDRFSPRLDAANVNIDLTGEASLKIRADADRLVQVFTNLLDNAIGVSPAGASVRVNLGSQTGRAEVTVTDSGPGIPMAEQERIFERFYQLDKSRVHSDRRGFGLGLAISHEIVQAHGGVINVESEIGQGSTFTVRIPVIKNVH